MLFKKETPLYSYEVIREGGQDILYINYLGAPFLPSIAESGEVMSRTVDALIENPGISRVVLVQQRNYNYPFSQVSLLLEIARLYTSFIKQENLLSPDRLGYSARIPGSQQDFAKRHSNMAYFLTIFKQNPLFAYTELKRFLENEHVDLKYKSGDVAGGAEVYIRLLEKIKSLFEATSFFSEFQVYLKDYKSGDREIYGRVFRPDVIPNFTFTRLVASLPSDAEIIEQYEISSGSDKSVVTILKRKDDLKHFYHLMPPEYSLNDEQYYLMNLARNVLIEHTPKAEEFTDPQRTRAVFFNVSRDLLLELSENKKIKLSYLELTKLANILVRHTIGFGLLEVLLQDQRIQDIVLNAPTSMNPVFIRHAEFDECSTNILPSFEDTNSWAAKFRILSGRPLDEANPILDTDLAIEGARARVAAIQQPLSPDGLAYAFRRHRDSPWTLPLFIKKKMLNPLAAGLLSFLIDGSRTMLIAGTRSSGKTSLLGSLMLEIMPKSRVVVLEDTLELPVEALRKIGYDILRMKVRSAMLEKTTEIAADEGIRTSLRLGDSSLIIGEVRSVEARALYEAMRVGALANVVAGTIHGASPYGVFDRVVNDLRVPATSFKATDCIVVANPVKTPDGLHSEKRVVQIAEVRKHWVKDPEQEGGFVDLLKYNVEKDELEPSEALLNGDSEIIKDIASGVKGWVGNWDAVYDNILLRGKIKQELVNFSDKMKMPELLEARFNSLSNAAFHNISDKVREETGLPLGERVFPLWQDWLKKAAKDFAKKRI